MKEFKKLVSAFLVVAMVVTLVTYTKYRCKCGCYNLLRKEDYFNSW